MKAGTVVTHFNRAACNRTSLAIALAMAICSVGTPRAIAAISGAHPISTVAHRVVLRQGEAITGTLPMTQPIHVEVALKLRNKGALDAFIANNVKNHVHDIAPQLMTSDRFLADHAPTRAQAQAVADYVTAMGFRNVTIAPNRLLVSADGTALTAGNAFMTSFAQVRTRDGRVAYANTDDVHVPAALADSVLAVVGLQSVHRPQVSARQATSAHTDAGGGTLAGHNPLEFSSIYVGVNIPTAAGVTIGILTQGNLAQTLADLNTFTANNSLATVATQTVNTGGTGSDTSQVKEWDLESQDIVGIAGGQVGKLVFYNVPMLDDAGLTADLNAAVSANAAKIVSVSSFECEADAQADGSAAADDAILETAVAQGQTFSVASGDEAQETCAGAMPYANWPAASQYVVAVAGTRLLANTTNWQSEYEWFIPTDPNGFDGSGNGPSAFEPLPSWQATFGVSSVTGVAATTRGIADVAFDADPNSGAKIIFNGASAQVGGTGLSASLFAGLWARAIATRGTGLGFAAPEIYSLYDTDFRRQDPDYSQAIQGGYLYQTGRGSINLHAAIQHLGVAFDHPPAANFTYLNGALFVMPYTEQAESFVAFTDHSTDSDGTVASYAWSLDMGGSNSSGTGPDPTHTYGHQENPGANVLETVTDNAGVSSSKILSVPTTIQQLILNPGFESGDDGSWQGSTRTITNNRANAPGEGTWYAWLDGKGTTHSDTLWQQVTIPVVSQAQLGFLLRIVTAETTTTLANDTLRVQVTDTSDNVLATLATYSNLNASNYASHVFDMTPYAGKTIKIKFIGHENASLQTSFYIDDVYLYE